MNREEDNKDLPKDDIDFIERRKQRRFDAEFKTNFRIITQEEELRLVEEHEGFQDLSVPVKSSGNGDLISTFTEDISVGGLKLNTEKVLTQGEPLLLEMHLPGIPMTVSALALVVWVVTEKDENGKYQAGLRFTAINSEDINRIKRYIVLQKKAEVQRGK